MKKETEKKLGILFEEWSGKKVEATAALADSGSYRQYYRLQGHGTNALGVFNQDKKEKAYYKKYKYYYSFVYKLPFSCHPV